MDLLLTLLMAIFATLFVAASTLYIFAILFEGVFGYSFGEEEEDKKKEDTSNEH